MTPSGLEFRNLEAFLAVNDLGGFSTAAHALGVTQSAISLRIKGLEDALGARLLERQSRVPKLTPQGTSLLPHARNIVDLVRATPATVSGSISGQLTVGAVPTVLLGLLPPALASLRDTYPDLHLTVRGGGSVQLAAGLATNASDIALLTEPDSVPDGMRFQPIASEPLMALVPAHLVDGGKGEQSRAEELISTTPYIWFNRNSWAGGQIGAHLQRLGIRVQAAMEIDSLEAVLSMVAAGLGVSVAPIAMAGLPVPDTVRALPFGDGSLRRSVGILYREGQPKMRLVSALAQALKHSAEGREDVQVFR